MIKKVLPIVLIAIFYNCQAAEVNTPFDSAQGRPADFNHTHCKAGFIKGVSWGWAGERGTYLGDAPAESMRKAAETNANWVCIAFAGYMNEANTPQISWGDNEPCMITDAEIQHAIELASKNNLKIILKPVVDIRDGNWRGYIDFKTTNNKTDMQAWDKWWGDFEKFLSHYAKIAEETKCDMLCLGCEMSTTERFESKWRGVIANIRKIYTGPITYNANHGNEDKVRWWNAVDIIGMSGYYPVGADALPPGVQFDPKALPVYDNSVEAIKKRWLPIRQKLKYVSRQFDRPVFFIEIGVCSAKGFSIAPWSHPEKNAVYDANEQARFYQATIEMFWDEPWFFGFVWWDWPAKLYSTEDAKTDTGFCFYGKAAEQVVKEWYAKPR